MTHLLNREMTLIAYVASPHDGYLKLFRKYAGGELFVLGNDFIEAFPSLTRHLPGNDPRDACRMLRALGIFRKVHVLGMAHLELMSRAKQLVMPDEDVMHAFAEQYLPGTRITFDPSWKLRWDLDATTHHRKPDGEVVVSTDEFDRSVMDLAHAEASRSPDWWRQVGGMLVRDGEILITSHNRHFPSDQTAYVMGDPRSNFGPGEHIDMSLALHAEISIFTEAARLGISTQGCSLYVTTFPCPPCANACANAGIASLYYRDGYSLVAGADALRARGVRIIRVE